MCGKYFKKKREHTKPMQKSISLFLIPVKDIKIPDIFFKIQKFIRASWASVIAHKDLLHLIIWMKTAPCQKISIYVSLYRMFQKWCRLAVQDRQISFVAMYLDKPPTPPLLIKLGHHNRFIKKILHTERMTNKRQCAFSSFPFSSSSNAFWAVPDVAPVSLDLRGGESTRELNWFVK